ncbi:MAG: hypothetical protein IT306_30390 [Chloroflexi bacterium]|nr:hypothetical protein [Chloroflexota bacterium]
MHRETAQAIWYRRLDRACFTSDDADTTTSTAAKTVERPATATIGLKGRWFPRFTTTSAAEEWRPLAEERRRWAVEASGDRQY